MPYAVSNRLIPLAFIVTIGAAGGAGAADYGAPVYDDPPALRGSYFEFGARYWYSTGRTDFDLYDGTGAIRISRLAYDDLDAHAGEIFFASQLENGVFVKGYGGLGVTPGGALNDEDFPPVVVPYSSTLSAQQDGNLKYFSADIGIRFLDAYNQVGHFQLAGFTGYHYWNESVHAFGCDQVAVNPVICVPAIAGSAKVISNEVEWHSWRVGIMGVLDAGNGLKLSGEAAWVPYTRLDNVDNHHLRPDINPLNSDGDGHGVQLEAVLSYDIDERISIGAGGRYWRLGRTEGHARFDNTPGGGIAQAIKFESERYGAFVQASVKLY